LRGDVGPGEQATWTNRIHRDDLLSALTFCVERPALQGTLLASDQEPARLGDMQTWVRSELARLHASATPLAGTGVPPGATAAATPGASAPPAPAGVPPDSLSPNGNLPPARVGGRTARADARKSRRILASRLTALGFTWHYPSYREGYLDLLRDA